MFRREKMPRHVHLVGSVPLADAREVFETVSRALGPYLARIPDGETGERLDWITWLEPIFAQHPAFEPSDETFQLHSGIARKDRRYRLKTGVPIESVRFDNLFYADVASRSYGVFAALKREGRIPAHCKLQVDLVPAHSVIWLYVQEHLHPAVDGIFNDAVRREIEKIAAAIPHDEPAIQIDVASAVFARLERNESSSYGRTKEEMRERFADIVSRLANHVPTDIDLLFHFCYGDAGHKHVIQPTDMGDMVDFANLLARRIARSIELIHMPVPRDRSDAAYFEPLQQLKLRPETEALPRPGAHHRRHRGHRQAPRHGQPICRRFRHRHRVRLRPARPRHHSRAAAHPCRDRRRQHVRLPADCGEGEARARANKKIRVFRSSFPGAA